MTTWVLVHGAGTGGWLWDGVAARLRSAGHQVFAPSLRGVGGQRPDAGGDVTLSDHIEQIVELFGEQQLEYAVLVGFSYGGFVITGAAARLGAAVEELIYLDAFVPDPGRSFFDLLPEAARASMMAAAAAVGEGRMVPPAPLELVGGLGALEAGVREEEVRAVLDRRGFHPLGGWQVVELATGHFAMLTMPTALTELLTSISLGLDRALVFCKCWTVHDRYEGDHDDSDVRQPAGN